MSLAAYKVALERRRARVNNMDSEPAQPDVAAHEMVRALHDIKEVLERHHRSTPRPLVS